MKRSQSKSLHICERLDHKFGTKLSESNVNKETQSVSIFTVVLSIFKKEKKKLLRRNTILPGTKI